jgi:hypothetical protein
MMMGVFGFPEGTTCGREGGITNTALSEEYGPARTLLGLGALGLRSWPIPALVPKRIIANISPDRFE